MTARERRALGTATVFLAPNVILVAVFLMLPILASLVIAFLDWDAVSSPESAGLANFTELAGDRAFRDALLTTGLFVLLTVPLTVALSLAVAVLLDSVAYGRSVLRILLFLPYAMSSVLVGLMWRWFYNPQYGLLNYLLSLVGITGPAWLNEPGLALPSVAAIFVWQQLGFNVVLFMVALREVPVELRWAVRVDLGGWWSELRHAVLPMISPVTFFVVLNVSFAAFQTFDLAYVTTRGGPAGSTTLVLQFIYENAFGSFRMGYASAAAFAYVLLIGLATWLIWASRRRWVLGES